ncbi:nucleotidyltransferase family protein [Synechococcus sp. A15-24]|uniref:nucleotidyltransferase family protein n=1 Tax=Synechococcus sp. A15-24 TaxID=1050635 RepID=UPI00164804F2|nr:nucleotidyltransferase family protein [Synechococcus sp. A15-24]QNJ27841.1 mobA-like NTP transferase domain protein [Synechococcus sp. A15-24]
MTQTFRALLLAAGLGTRLRPITLHTPKCLVNIGGEALLGRWLRQLELAGCEAVLINTHYLADQVEAFLQSWKSSTMSVKAAHEPELLGTAGTLISNQDFFRGATGLLIHADNAMAGGLDGFLTAHRERQPCCQLTMLTFHTDTPESCGIVEIDDQQVVQAFHEKIANPPGNRANGALYAFEQDFLDHLSLMNQRPSDFSTEVIPKLLGRIQTWHTHDAYLDIGTPEALTSAQKLMRHK